MFNPPAVNPTEALFRAAGAFNSLSPLDESVCAAREQARERDRLQAEISELRDALAERDELIAALQEQLAPVEA